MTAKTAAESEPLLLYPETISRRRLPVNFDRENLVLFVHELEKTIPETRLLELQGVRISSEGILFSGHRILPESFAFPANLKRWKRRSRLKFFVKNNFFRRSRTV